MCRFLVYKGKSTLLADLVTRPNNSLIMQSYSAKEREEPLNGDGFGLGWYAPEIDETPCLFKSITPAWANSNLQHLAEKISSPCFFAHVRAASPGLVVNEQNCHPFQYGNLLWMHNGNVEDFPKIKRKLRETLRDDLYNWIQGSTDSEHAFAVFLNQFPEDKTDFSLSELKDALVKTISILNQLSKKVGSVETSIYNFAVSDGKRIVASRYSSKPKGGNATLYYASCENYACVDGVCSIDKAKDSTKAVLIASEPLTEIRSDWNEIPLNNLILVDKDNSVSLEKLAI